MTQQTDASDGRGMRPNGFLGAAQFLTRVPIRLRAAADPATTVPWFPIVGAIIGAVVGGSAAGLLELVPSAVAAVVAVSLSMMITGAFHEDGLADSADALGGWSAEHRREILKDSRHGSYGVAAMVATILVRVACIASLGPAVAFGGIVAAHTLGRGAALGVMATTDQAPADGLGADASRALSTRGAIVGITAALALAAVAVGWWVGPIALAVAMGAVAVRHIARSAFGGINGDLLGATEQVGECLALIVVSGLALRHPLWWA